jgi:hypothetical protein
VERVIPEEVNLMPEEMEEEDDEESPELMF